MKTKLFLVAVFSVFLSLAQIFASANTNISGNDPDVKVVISQKRIWLVTDEISVKSLTVRVLNAKGKVVMEKQFSSKVTDWSLRIESLPEGRYTVEVGEKKIADFSR